MFDDFQIWYTHKMDESHTKLVSYDPAWRGKYQEESSKLTNLFGNLLIDIQHIGSTSIIGLASKPIIDIVILLPSHQDAEKYIGLLEEKGYEYDANNSSGERHFFRKGNPTQFHLSVAYQDQGGFWKRQLLFRDYLLDHPEARKEYQRIKEIGMLQDPTGGTKYIESKTNFVQDILKQAGS